MIIIKNTHELEKELNKIRSQSKTIGFVPTMGALHQGHLALVKTAKRQNKVVVVSIFVNPTQFNSKEDLAKYPVTLENDTDLLCQVGCDILFLPSVQEMYPNGFDIKNKIDFGFIASTLEGEFRPGHFDGMAQIVEKLLHAVKPDKLYMGLKDYQQALIVGELIKTRKMKVELVKCPTKREADGLAMSSRNMRLDKASRKLAVELSKTLFYFKRKVSDLRKKELVFSIHELENLGLKRLKKFPEISVEYLRIRDAATLKEQKQVGKSALVALVAANVGGVRLIDNVVI